MLVVTIYAVFALIAISNWVLMRRPPKGAGEASLVFLIPARNEAENLKRLLPKLTSERVYVFDDESDDGTGTIAQQLGATVIRPRESLPAGWTGKNRACHMLGQAVTEDSDAEWLVFLDADVYPTDDFVSRLKAHLAATERRVGVVTGFPTIIPGRGIEPLFLLWVGWGLLAISPFGLSARLRVGHNRFTNGQFHCWRKEIYGSLWPNEQVRHHVMEDAMIGRLLAKNHIPTEVTNVAPILGVKMYENWRQTFDGMSKNSYEAAGTITVALLMAVGLSLAGWGWIAAGSLWWLALGLFLVSGVALGSLANTPPWPLLLMPVGLTIGSLTMLRSMVWHKRGTVTWKGRTYPGIETHSSLNDSRVE